MAASMGTTSAKLFHPKLAFTVPRRWLSCRESVKLIARPRRHHKYAFDPPNYCRKNRNFINLFVTLNHGHGGRKRWPCSRTYRTCTVDHASKGEVEHIHRHRQSNRNKTVSPSKLNDDGRSLKDFIIASSQCSTNEGHHGHELHVGGTSYAAEIVPYLHKSSYDARNRNVYFETYGCQMNVSDTEIAWAILQKNGFQKVDDALKADVILAVTCAIRENAEQKIWNRLEYFQALKKRRRKGQPPLKVGLLGCMAERLKKEILERSKIVDIVAGPDAYRDLPRLLSVADSGQAAINVMLSTDETYADVVPVRLSPTSKSAFISIMRGCDNMCSYCIVPFTRGRERSRPVASILDEVRILSDQGVKEITLLGQNVNSYRDTSEAVYYGHGTAADTDANNQSTSLAKGFNTIYKHKQGGLRFADLLDRVSAVDPEIRIRFTSPHPKDFPDEVLHVIRDRDNVCKQVHMPAQSGSTEVLQRMRRGYTREAYLDLVDHIRSIIPRVSLTSDFITGFCGETEADHDDTLSLLRLVRYNYAFLFAYSMRKKTHAYHRMMDDVPEEVKQRRLREVIAVCREIMQEVNTAQIGQRQLVLIEGTSKRSDKDLVGRNDGNIKVIVPNIKIPCTVNSPVDVASIHAGDYVIVQIDSCNSEVLKGTPVCFTTLRGFHCSEPETTAGVFAEISR